jgi:protoporphyrinogen oxidase
MLAKFRERLESLGVEIRTGSSVTSVIRNDTGQLDVNLAGGTLLTFDRVVVTTPAPVAAKLCPQLRSVEQDRLSDVEYLGILCASLLLKKPLAGYYVTNITDPAPFTGVIEMTALVDPNELKGRTLVYLPKYLTALDPAWSQSDSQIEAEFIAGLRRLFPQFAPEDLLAFRLSRVRHVFALSTLDYSRRVPPIETSVPGLFLVNSAQIVNGTLNVNETVRLAESSLETLSAPVTDTRIRSETPSSFANYVAANSELVARPG